MKLASYAAQSSDPAKPCRASHGGASARKRGLLGLESADMDNAIRHTGGISVDHASVGAPQTKQPFL